MAARYLAKGALVYVEGRIQTRKWQDRAGTDRYSTEIIAQVIQILGPAQGDQPPSQAEPPSSPLEPEDDFDKCPF